LKKNDKGEANQQAEWGNQEKENFIQTVPMKGSKNTVGKGSDQVKELKSTS